ncbi:hypothetical protein VP01_4593g1 [Puccinia sorghi]|uniref:Uncharacterized protein n=1 Tax=Puccinia sorghi TaxID=27349 RepID=A0A0L6UNK5_9BASI|nr:hypothetical protein VP01_4593g1 [Puccinia sorghi]
MTCSARQACSRCFHKEIPLSLHRSVPFTERKAYKHQSHKGTREVPPTNQHPNESGPCMALYRFQSTRLTTFRVIRGLANCKLQPSSEVYCIRCSPSQTPQSTKPLISLPKLNSPHHQALVSSTCVPHLINEYHSILENPPTSTFNTLSKIIQTLYAMAQFCPANKVNSNIITDEMHMIGFHPGSDRGKSSASVSQHVSYCLYGIHLLNISAEQEFNARIRYPQLVTGGMGRNGKKMMGLSTALHLMFLRISTDGHKVFSLTSKKKLVNQSLILPVI